MGQKKLIVTDSDIGRLLIACEHKSICCGHKVSSQTFSRYAAKHQLIQWSRLVMTKKSHRWMKNAQSIKLQVDKLTVDAAAVRRLGTDKQTALQEWIISIH